MTRHTVALLLYVIGGICLIVGLLDVLNVVDWNEGSGWGLIIGGVILAAVGAVLDSRPRV